MKQAISDRFFSTVFDARVNYTKAGHALNEMLLECSFQRMECDARNFSTWVRIVVVLLTWTFSHPQSDPAYGNCYTFTVDKNEPDYSAFVGPSYGLSLTLYADEQGNYLDTLTGGVGWRVRENTFVFIGGLLSFTDPSASIRVSELSTRLGLFRLARLSDGSVDKRAGDLATARTLSSDQLWYLRG